PDHTLRIGPAALVLLGIQARMGQHELPSPVAYCMDTLAREHQHPLAVGCGWPAEHIVQPLGQTVGSGPRAVVVSPDAPSLHDDHLPPFIEGERDRTVAPVPIAVHAPVQVEPDHLGPYTAHPDPAMAVLRHGLATGDTEVPGQVGG